MHSAERLRDYAEECLRLARENRRPRDRSLLLNMAQTWLALSIQLERISTLSKTAGNLNGRNGSGTSPIGP